MGNHDSHHPIRITNKSGKRIKVRVDVNKMELKCSYVGTTFDRHSKSIDHNGKVMKRETRVLLRKTEIFEGPL